ncbi:MAG: SUMF1/EgtB/PvdO family nonheme iron enzyme [Nanoarchaeota archaeon]|nr:SUMF1/EgtB/PvdO family nonheme iron enzyme [Nanoarchaeota archaeon]
MSLDAVLRRATLAFATGIALLAGGTQNANASEPIIDAKKEPSLYELLLSHDISERRHAIEGLLATVQAQKTEYSVGKTAMDEISNLQKLAKETGLEIPADFFKSQEAYVKSVLAEKPSSKNSKSRFAWAAEFNPTLWKDAVNTAVGNTLSRVIQTLEVKYATDKGYVIPPDMVWIPAGPFIKGSDPKELVYFKTQTLSAGVQPRWTEPLHAYSNITWESEASRTPTIVLKSLLVYKYELTNTMAGEYYSAHPGKKTAVGANWTNAPQAPYAWKDGVVPPPGMDDRPFSFANLYMARDMAKFFGAKLSSGKLEGRLLTEDEWEYTARGGDGRCFPWGNELDLTKGAFRETVKERGEFLAKVGSFPGDVSPFGVYDMGGNIGEWVDTPFTGPLTPASPSNSRTSDTTSDRMNYPDKYIIKAGAVPVSGGLGESHSARRVPMDPAQGDRVGVRIAMDIPPEFQYILAPNITSNSAQTSNTQSAK